MWPEASVLKDYDHIPKAKQLKEMQSADFPQDDISDVPPSKV
jgi:hypothetical protein